MSDDLSPTDVARVLAELLDLALADDWNDDEETMALLWQTSADPGDVRIAVRRLEGSVAAELRPMAELGGYLAVAHSMVTSGPVPELLHPAGGQPVRITLAVDHQTEAGVVRHQNGSTEWFGAIDLPIVRTVRSMLDLEPGAAA